MGEYFVNLKLVVSGGMTGNGVGKVADVMRAGGNIILAGAEMKTVLLKTIPGWMIVQLQV